MFTRFYESTVVTRFIQYLLSSVNIPMIPYYIEGTSIKEDGLRYIYKNGLYRVQNGALEYKQPFVLGKRYPNITTSYISDSLAYTPKAHEYLGDYLRVLRDFLGLDLMPFYNCFCNTYEDSIDITDNGPENIAADKQYKVLSVPICFNQDYSIYVDSDTGFTCDVVVKGRNAIVQFATDSIREKNDTKKHCYRSSFKKPFIFSKLTSYTQIDFQYGKNLYLLIKLPRNNNSSIVVLEGDYSKVPCSTAINGELNKPLLIVEGSDEETAPDIQPSGDIGTEETWAEATDVKLGPLKLNWFNDGYIYAFTDTLPQYLLWNVICQLDPIDDNIKRVQQYITSDKHYRVYRTIFSKPYKSGIWNDDMRDYLFNLVMTNIKVNPQHRLDACGYVDKATERILLRGQTDE